MDAVTLARQLVPEQVERGALAVALTGSHARGEATAGSDVDLIVVGEGPSYRLDVREGMLVAESWGSEDVHRARRDDPRHAGAAVVGWREALVLHDPDGIAARLRQEALEWSWGQLGERCDVWSADQVADLAEEAHKLAAALDTGRTLTAVVQRDLLVLRLAPVLAVHHRLLYGSENVLWEQVAELMGEEWRRAQSAAFATRGESFRVSCTAALVLYRLAGDRVAHLFDERQAAVVRHALAAAALATRAQP